MLLFCICYKQHLSQYFRFRYKTFLGGWHCSLGFLCTIFLSVEGCMSCYNYHFIINQMKFTCNFQQLPEVTPVLLITIISFKKSPTLSCKHQIKNCNFTKITFLREQVTLKMTSLEMRSSDILKNKCGMEQ